MWVVTKCHYDPKERMPRWSRDNVNSEITGLPEHFKMYDDDDILYYSGRSSSKSFRPLDEFGMPNAGATRIDYLDAETKTWETL